MSHVPLAVCPMYSWLRVPHTDGCVSLVPLVVLDLIIFQAILLPPSSELLAPSLSALMLFQSPRCEREDVALAGLGPVPVGPWSPLPELLSLLCSQLSFSFALLGFGGERVRLCLSCYPKRSLFSSEAEPWEIYTTLTLMCQPHRLETLSCFRWFQHAAKLCTKEHQVILGVPGASVHS